MEVSTRLLKEKKICNHRINIRLRAFIPLKIIQMLLQKMCNFTVDANYLCNISLFKPVTTEIIRLHALRTAGMKVVLKHINVIFFTKQICDAYFRCSFFLKSKFTRTTSPNNFTLLKRSRS